MRPRPAREARAQSAQGRGRRAAWAACAVAACAVAAGAVACDAPAPPEATPAPAPQPAPARAEPAGPAPLGMLLPEQLDRLIVLRGAAAWGLWRDALSAAPECAAAPQRCAVAPIEGLPALDQPQAEAMGWALDEGLALARFGSTAALVGVPARPLAGALSAWAGGALGGAPVSTREVEREGWTVGQVVRGEGDQAEPVLAWMERRGRALVWFGPALAAGAPPIDRATAVWVASIARPRLLTWMPYSAGQRALGALGPLWGYSALATSAAAPDADADPALDATHVVWSIPAAAARRSVWLQTHAARQRALAAPHLDDDAPAWLIARPSAAWVRRALAPEALPAQPLDLLQVGMAGPAAARPLPIPALDALRDGAPDGALVVAAEPVPDPLREGTAALDRGAGAFRRPLWREGWSALRLAAPQRAEAALTALADTRQLLRVGPAEAPAYAIGLARQPSALLCIRRGWLVLAHGQLPGVCAAPPDDDDAPSPAPLAEAEAAPPSLALLRGAPPALRPVEHVAATRSPLRLLRTIAAPDDATAARVSLHPLGLALHIGADAAPQAAPAPNAQTDADPTTDADPDEGAP